MATPVPIFGFPVTVPDVAVVSVTGGTGTAGAVVVVADDVVVAPDDVELEDPEPDVVERPGDTCWLSGPPVMAVVVVV